MLTWLTFDSVISLVTILAAIDVVRSRNACRRTPCSKICYNTDGWQLVCASEGIPTTQRQEWTRPR